VSSSAPPTRPEPDADGHDAAGQAYAGTLDRGHRRRSGAFYTPPAIAAGLVAVAADGLDLGPPSRPTVCDPAVGGGAFLLAAARHLERAGHDRATIVGHLVWGADVDAAAVAVARDALESWAAASGAVVEATHVVVGDSLSRGRAVWPDAPTDGFDLVVGNPPFLNQLETRTARPRRQAALLRDRLGTLVRPYADAAALFLADGAWWLAPGGRLALILPESVLAARDAGPARAAASARAAVVGFWWPGQAVFDAMVDVCAPILARGAPAGPVRRWFGPDFTPLAPAEPLGPAPAGELGHRSDPAPLWSPLLDRSAAEVARAVSRLAGHAVLGSRVEATAGFRDQFYGVAPHVYERDAASVSAGDAAVVPLVTVGLIDPLHLRWGSSSTRFAGRRWAAPAVDLVSLAAQNPALARWAQARLVPKVVLATQTRILEPVVDGQGAWWPSVPAIAVTPRSGDPDELWAVAAVLASPAVSAWALARYRGSALSRDAIKLAATQVRELPLPGDTGAWAEGAGAARRAQEGAEAADPAAWRQALIDLGAAMTAAYRSGPEVQQWWVGRLPPWR